MHEERKKVWIDPFQTMLTQRIAGYLVVFFIVFCNFLFAWKMIEEGPVNPWQQFLQVIQENIPVIICLSLLVPVMAWDSIRFSHRLVGPLVRFRKACQELADGKPVRPVKLREGDYLTQVRRLQQDARRTPETRRTRDQACGRCGPRRAQENRIITTFNQEIPHVYFASYEIA